MSDTTDALTGMIEIQHAKKPPLTRTALFASLILDFLLPAIVGYFFRQAPLEQLLVDTEVIIHGNA